MAMEEHNIYEVVGFVLKGQYYQWVGGGNMKYDDNCRKAPTCKLEYCGAGACLEYESREPYEAGLDPKSRYYDHGGLETIDIIKAKLPDFQSYLQGNILKYASRLPYKGQALRDAEKIVIYAKMLRNELNKDE